MHTWTVTCDSAAPAESGTAATEVAAVAAGAAVMRRLVRDTHRIGEDSPYVRLRINARFRIGVIAAPSGVADALDRIDLYEYEDTVAAAVNDSIIECSHIEASLPIPKTG